MLPDDIEQRLARAIRARATADAARGGAIGAKPQGGTALTPAAVLVPLVLRPAGTTVLLTQRTDHLYDHAGQISFPGGRLDPGDSTPEAAALREAEEEVGLSPGRVELIGRLDTYVIARTGFEVVPTVGLVHPPIELRPDPFEVAAVFEVPLSFVLDRNNHQRHTRTFDGVERWFHVMQFEERYIWGATAAMLVNLVDMLGEP